MNVSNNSECKVIKSTWNLLYTNKSLSSLPLLDYNYFMSIYIISMFNLQLNDIFTNFIRITFELERNYYDIGNTMSETYDYYFERIDKKKCKQLCLDTINEFIPFIDNLEDVKVNTLLPE